MVVAEPVVQPFVLRGQAKKLWLCRDPEVLFDGKRGSGKSRPMCEYIVRYALANQGCRVAVVRKTRKSLSQTTLVTLESVLRDLCPSALTGCQRSHVERYMVGESELIPIGCDDEEKLRGLEVSVLWIDEGTELLLKDYESLQGSVRWPIAPWHISIITCNPDSDMHWIWRLFKDGRLTRIESSHADNPAVTQEYLDRLSRLTGIARKRFYEGIWCAAEGQVLEAYDPDVNCITLREKPDGTPDYDSLSISWYFATMDWGLAGAGCMAVWGVDLENRIYQVAEIYFQKKYPNWWCEAVVEMNKRFRLAAIVCDPARPDMIGDFNIRLGYHPEAPDAICFGANNKRANTVGNDMAGVALMAEMMSKQADGKPALYFVRDNQPYGIDQDLRDQGLPVSALEEIPSYVFAKSTDGRYLRDVIDKNCIDHGLDNVRYACMFARYRDLSESPGVPKDEPESYGALYGHNRMVAAIEAAQVDGVSIEEAMEAFELEDA